MNLVFNHRASAILYHFIKSNKHANKVWIIPTNVCHYVAATILKAGAQIEILDVDSTLCLDRKKTLEKLRNNDHYAGIIYVRTFGVDLEVNSFFDAIKTINKNLFIVDDLCLSVPNFDRLLNPLVDLELYSTGYSKYVDIGFGGYAKIQNHLKYEEQSIPFLEKEEAIFDQYFRALIFESKPIIKEELNATVQLNWLKSSSLDKEKYQKLVIQKREEISKTKKEINVIYEAGLESIKLKNSASLWRFNIVVDNRDKVLNLFAENDLFASKHYYSLSKIFPSEKTPFWDGIQNNIINLFNDFRYSKSQAEQTVELLKKTLKI
ncbi:MAG: hypothetical protein N4A45_09165 [Flavobacteriales bacterium]|jgi:hypothetical protein|nr:hypothetical protein [Flavobacteriales bacterium]